MSKRELLCRVCGPRFMRSASKDKLELSERVRIKAGNRSLVETAHCDRCKELIPPGGHCYAFTLWDIREETPVDWERNFIENATEVIV